MQVFYTARRLSPRLPVVYRAGRVSFCCAEMERHWMNRLIAFGLPGQDSTSKTVNLCVPVPQVNGGTVVAVTPVAFCPWCAAAVEACLEK